MTSITVKGSRLLVEIAATPSARVCGLSRRADLPQNQGMLFVFPEKRNLTFTMRNTRIPLTIAFLDDVGRILGFEKMTPMQTTVKYPSPGPARFALEVNQGWFAENGIRVGDLIDFQLPAILNIR